MERLHRLCTADEYHRADKIRNKAQEQLQNVKDDLDALQAEQEQAEATVAEQNADIDKLTRSKEQEMGPDFKKIEANVTELSKKMVRFCAMLLLA